VLIYFLLSGVLEYFRLQLPKRYQNEKNFEEFLNVWQTQVHFKVTNKKILKYEKSYELRKRLEKDRKDPHVRIEYENRALRQQIHRLERENDEIANELINYQLDSKTRFDQLKNLNEYLQLEIIRAKQDQMLINSNYNDSISEHQFELFKIKELYRSNLDSFDFVLKQNESVRFVNKKLSANLDELKIEIKKELGGLFDWIASVNVNPENVKICDCIDAFIQKYMRL
jgi:hypothetical protein